MNASPDDRVRRRDGTILKGIVGRGDAPGSPRMEPASAFEAVTRQMVVDLTIEIQALRARIDSLFSVVVGAILLDLLLRLAGWR